MVTFATTESFSALVFEKTVSSSNDLAFDIGVFEDMATRVRGTELEESVDTCSDRVRRQSVAGGNQRKLNTLISHPHRVDVRSLIKCATVWIVISRESEKGRAAMWWFSLFRCNPKGSARHSSASKKDHPCFLIVKDRREQPNRVIQALTERRN